ncbi:MAG: OmpA family protein, partial [Bacteroidia bacterium]
PPPPVAAHFDTPVVAVIDTLKPSAPAPATAEPPAGEIVPDQPLVLKNVLFETGKAVLLPSSYAELNTLAGHLAEKPGLKIEISGHTDNKGNASQNTLLSEKRAKAVCDYLIEKRIDPGRIRYKGYGSLKPIADNETEEGRQLNRRVELVFLK